MKRCKVLYSACFPGRAPNAARLRIRGTHAGHPVVSVEEHAMVFDVADHAALAVRLGVKPGTRMRRYRLQRITLIELLSTAAFPRMDAFVDRRSLWILETRECEFELSGLCLQAAQILLAILARQG